MEKLDHLIGGITHDGEGGVTTPSYLPDKGLQAGIPISTPPDRASAHSTAFTKKANSKHLFIQKSHRCDSATHW